MRVHRKKRGMLIRMLAGAAMLRKRSALAALTAIVAAAAAATAMLNLFSDVQSKVQREFRNFGANIVLNAPEGKSLSRQELNTVRAVVDRRGLAVPFAYAVARTITDQSIVVAGTDLELAKRLNPWWSASAWPQAPGEALIGIRAARAISRDDRK